MGCQMGTDSHKPTPISRSHSIKSPAAMTKTSRVHPVTTTSINSRADTNTFTPRLKSLPDESPLTQAKSEPSSSTRISAYYSVLYLVDHHTSRFLSYSLDSKKWNINKFSNAALHSTNPNLIPLRSLEDEVLCYLPEASSVLVSNTLVHFIGEKHFAYCMKENLFSYRKSRIASSIKNSIVCKVGNNIFAISGEEGSDYSTKCEKYDILQNTWTSIASLKQPCYKGSVLAYVDAYGAQKIAVLGGLASKTSDKVNQVLSIYDISANKWSEVKINLPLQINPSAPSLPAFLYEDDVACLLAPKGDKLQLYHVNLTDGKVSMKRELSLQEKQRNMVIESFNYRKGAFLAVLSDQELSSSDSMKVSENTKQFSLYAINF